MSRWPDSPSDVEVAIAFARCELANGGWPPTLDEVGDALSRSRSTLHQSLARMVESGLLESRAAGRSGGLAYRCSRWLLVHVVDGREEEIVALWCHDPEAVRS